MAKKKTADAEAAPHPTTGSAEYTVLARRYRPQQFTDLVGQEAVAQALCNALKSNRVAHAYLFTGARGVGKTSTARILARALNCVTGPTPTPCGTCESCLGIATGEDMDVLEIDGASNNKVEEVRELRQNVQYRPNRSRYKIYIIDEVHMLSTSAFNALLKTLEEPPSHVKFIFATTEVQKIPVTILSRCQRFDFTGISSKRIGERLQSILAEEGVTAEPGVLELVARRAGGSMRDGQSLLDQVMAFGGKNLTLGAIHQLLGTADEDQVAALAAAVLERDLPRSLTLFGEAIEGGVQLGEFTDQLLEYWRDLMLIQAAGGTLDGLGFSPRFHEAMQRQAKAMTMDSILAGMDMLAAAKSRLRGTNHGRVLLEMTLVRLARLEELLPLSELALQLARVGPGSPRPPAARVGVAPTPALPVEPLKKKLSDNGQASVPIALSPETLPAIWASVVAGLGGIFGVDLESAGLPAISAPNCLVLRFSAAYNGQREHCEEPSRNARIEEALYKATGQRIAVRYETAPEGAKQSDEPEAPRPVRAEQARRSAAQEPLVRAIMDHLEANLVKADDGFGNAPAVQPTDSEESS